MFNQTPLFCIKNILEKKTNKRKQKRTWNSQNRIQKMLKTVDSKGKKILAMSQMHRWKLYAKYEIFRPTNGILIRIWYAFLEELEKKFFSSHWTKFFSFEFLTFHIARKDYLWRFYFSSNIAVDASLKVVSNKMINKMNKLALKTFFFSDTS